MLNANETIAAINALVYPSGIADRDERVAAHAVYRAETSRIHGEFRDWLAYEYASSMPANVQSKIWEKAWEDGHSGGYNEVEGHYKDYVEFAEVAFNAGRNTARPTAG